MSYEVHWATEDKQSQNYKREKRSKIKLNISQEQKYYKKPVGSTADQSIVCLKWVFFSFNYDFHTFSTHNQDNMECESITDTIYWYLCSY